VATATSTVPTLWRGLTAGRALAIVVLVGVVVRVAWWLSYEPVVEGDAITYMTIAMHLQNGTLHLYDGAAPPAYPLLIMLAGFDAHRIWAIQSLLGIAAPVILFGLALRATGSTAAGLVAGLGAALALDQLVLESFLVTETMSTFLLVAGVWLLVDLRLRERPLWSVALLSTVFSLAGLTRPFLLFMLPLSLLWVLRPPEGTAPLTTRRRLRRLVAWAVPAAVLVGGVSLYNGVTLGVYGPSTMTGFRLAQHAGAWMEEAPDRDAVIRDVYLAHRERFRAEGRSHADVIWAAIPEMQRRTGLSYGALSQRVGALSAGLIARRPLRYAASAGRAWLRFWKKTVMLRPDHLRAEEARGFWTAGAWAQRAGGIAVNAAFLAVAAWALLRRVRLHPVESTLLAVVLVASVVQALAELSDNGRFAVPFQPLVWVAVVIAGHRLVVLRGAGPSAAP
jgi:hypothetical protein